MAPPRPGFLAPPRPGLLAPPRPRFLALENLEKHAKTIEKQRKTEKRKQKVPKRQKCGGGGGGAGAAVHYFAGNTLYSKPSRKGKSPSRLLQSISRLGDGRHHSPKLRYINNTAKFIKMHQDT